MAESKKVSELDSIQNLSDDDEFVVIDKNMTNGNDASSTGKTSKVSLAQLKNEIGTKGLKGDLGKQGEKGIKGNSGIQGVTGAKGLPGFKGDVGEPGISGEDGIKGYRGGKGQRGSKGLPGEKGFKGRKGNTIGPGGTGNPGPVGDRGGLGERGEKGPLGQKGQKGTKGIKGEVGFDGDRSIAGDTGFKGYIGAFGAKGTGGDQGDRGDPGNKGDKGRKGLKGIKGPKGGVGPMNYDGGSARGEKGYKGRKGRSGQKGTAQTYPYSSGNSNFTVFDSRNIEDNFPKSFTRTDFGENSKRVAGWQKIINAGSIASTAKFGVFSVYASDFTNWDHMGDAGTLLKDIWDNSSRGKTNIDLPYIRVYASSYLRGRQVDVLVYQYQLDAVTGFPRASDQKGATFVAPVYNRYCVLNIQTNIGRKNKVKVYEQFPDMAGMGHQSWRLAEHGLSFAKYDKFGEPKDFLWTEDVYEEHCGVPIQTKHTDHLADPYTNTGDNSDGSARQIASRCQKFPHHMSEYVKISHMGWL